MNIGDMVKVTNFSHQEGGENIKTIYGEISDINETEVTVADVVLKLDYRIRFEKITKQLEKRKLVY